MGYPRRVLIDGGTVRVFTTDRSDGDFQIRDPAPDVETRRRAIVDAPWTWIHQVHGTTVLEVSEPGEHAGATADGLFTMVPGCPIAVTTADCPPVVLVAERGVAVVHAGWRGLVDGIVESTGDRLIERAGRPVEALVGPCIHPNRYEFGADDMATLIQRYGEEVKGLTAWGTTALDIPTAVGRACQEAGWKVTDIGPCTSSDAYFSHRTRGDDARQTTVAWIEAAPG